MLSVPTRAFPSRIVRSTKEWNNILAMNPKMMGVICYRQLNERRGYCISYHGRARLALASLTCRFR